MHISSSSCPSSSFSSLFLLLLQSTLTCPLVSVTLPLISWVSAKKSYEFSISILKMIWKDQLCILLCAWFITFFDHLVFRTNNLFVTSKNVTTNSPIHEFKVLHKGQRAFLKPLFDGVLFLIYYFKKHFKPCLFISKALKDIL